MKSNSEFAKYVTGIMLDNRPLPTSLVNDIIRFSREGINPEMRDTASDSSAPLTDSATLTRAEAQKPDSGFQFGAGSKKELTGVEPKLVAVVGLALKYSSIDFVVFDGIRTYKEQMNHVRNGTSKTMASKHLDGLAVDLVPYIGGKPVWDWDGCYRIAMAMDRAATELGCADRVRWGGAWDRTLADFGGDWTAYKKEVEQYKSRHAGADFIDGPHFEWLK